MVSALYGASAMGSFVIGLVFLQSWRRSLDHLFVMFAWAFFLLGVHYSIIAVAAVGTEWRPYDSRRHRGQEPEPSPNIAAEAHRRTTMRAGAASSSGSPANCAPRTVMRASQLQSADSLRKEMS
jgi:hypothetical protein